MNKNTLIYFHTEEIEFNKHLFDFCTDMNISLYCCQKLDTLFYMLEKIKPMYVVINNHNLSNEDIDEISVLYRSHFIYVVSNNYKLGRENVFIGQDIYAITPIVQNHYRCFSSFINLNLKDQNFCNRVVTDTLKDFGFKNTNLGVKYITELIYEMLTNTSITRGKCVNIFPKIANKYNTNPANIERLIRFAINNGYTLCKDKQKYFEVSKSNRAPSITEMASYLLDKVVIALATK